MKSSIKFFILITPLISACSKSNLDYDILSSIKLDCPDGWSRAYRGWGERGLMSYCQIQNGPIIAAEYGSLKVKGQYKMGKKIGLWQSFDENGNIINSEYYPD